MFDYVREHRDFIRRAAREGLSGNEMLLWYALAELWADAGAGTVEASTRQLLALVPFSADTLARTVRALSSRGIIAVDTVGRGRAIYTHTGGASGQDQEPKPQEEPQTSPQIAAINAENADCPQISPQIAAINAENAAGPYMVYNNYTQEIDKIDDDDEDMTRARARGDRLGRMTETATRAYRTCFGREPAAAEARRIALSALMLGFDDAMLELCIQQAAVNGARAPFAYCAQILRDWAFEGVYTEEDFGEFSYWADLRDGRIPGRPPDIAQRMEGMRQERRARHAHPEPAW